MVLGAVFDRRRRDSERDQARQDRAERYSQPLMAAASSLAARLGNAMDVKQVEEFAGRRKHYAARFEDYMVYETLYRLARYLCWVHLVTRELRVLDLGNRERNRDLVTRIADVQAAMNRRSDDLDQELPFLLLGGEQSTLAELMIERDLPDGEPRCMSYVTFRTRLQDESFRQWFEPLLHDIRAHPTAPMKGGQRLKAVETALYALIDVLDPDRIWIPFQEADAGT
ncbi:MAG: hypothetical protein ACRDO7_03895 [Nocardioidaceae bacterium]